MKYRLRLTLYNEVGRNISLFIDIPEDYANKIRAFKLTQATVEVQECLPNLAVPFKRANLDDIKEGED